MFGKKKETLKVRVKEKHVLTYKGTEFTSTSENQKYTYIADWKLTDEPFDETNDLMKQETYYVWESDDGVEFKIQDYDLRDYNFEDIDKIKEKLRYYHDKAVKTNLGIVNKKRFLEDKEWIEI